MPPRTRNHCTVCPKSLVIPVSWIHTAPITWCCWTHWFFCPPAYILTHTHMETWQPTQQTQIQITWSPVFSSLVFSILCSLFSIRHAIFIAPYSLFTIPYSLFSIVDSLFSVLYSLVSIHYSLFFISCFLFPILYFLFTILYSLFCILYSLFPVLYSLFTIPYAFFSILYSLPSIFFIPYSLFSILYSVFSILYSLFHYSLFPMPNSLFPIRYPLFSILFSWFSIHYSLFTILCSHIPYSLGSILTISCPYTVRMHTCIILCIWFTNTNMMHAHCFSDCQNFGHWYFLSKNSGLIINIRQNFFTRRLRIQRQCHYPGNNLMPKFETYLILFTINIKSKLWKNHKIKCMQKW